MLWLFQWGKLCNQCHFNAIISSKLFFSAKKGWFLMLFFLTLLDFNALSIAQLFRVNKNRQHVCIKFSMLVLNEHIKTYDDHYFVNMSTETLLILLINA